MTTDSDRAAQTQRLDKAMDRRRRELRLRWNQVADRAGMTYGNLHKIRTGQITVSDFAADGIEDALEWERGSVARVLVGEEPGPATVASDVDEEIVQRLKAIKRRYGRQVFLDAAIRVAEIRDEAGESGDVSGTG